MLVNRRYYQELRHGPQDKGSKAWLADCLASANWLMKALDQRQRTIIRVATDGASPTLPQPTRRGEMMRRPHEVPAEPIDEFCDIFHG